MPSPAAMETVMELFNEDRIAHPQNPHVFVVPRLMTHLWRKNLGKDADVMFTVAPAGHFGGEDRIEGHERGKAVDSPTGSHGDGHGIV